jgi:hypothetical protein
MFDDSKSKNNNMCCLNKNQAVDQESSLDEFIEQRITSTAKKELFPI